MKMLVVGSVNYMTIVTIKQSDNRYELSIQGHAMFNPGNDIVCSAISCLTYTFAESLMQGDFCEVDEITIESGNVNIRVKITSQHDFELVAKCFETGYLMVEKSYSDYVEVNI